MLSFRHEILVDLFRENGELAAELLRRCAGIAIDHDRVERGSIDLSQVAPTEYRADNVAILHGRDGRPVTSVIVEVQRGLDRDKLLSWRSTSLPCAPSSPARQCSWWSRPVQPLRHGRGSRSSRAIRGSG